MRSGHSKKAVPGKHNSREISKYKANKKVDKNSSSCSRVKGDPPLMDCRCRESMVYVIA